jgi:hypothetical protein
MSTMTTFDTTPEALGDLLRSVQNGRTQLPDFQRGWVWDDAHIRSLLASVSLSYPVGAIMMLQAGGEDVRFKTRSVEGVKPEGLRAPERLILDGQQRLTSLYQALLSSAAVETRDSRGNPMKRWYYVDINKALSPHHDREDAIVSIPENRKLLNFRGEETADYSTLEREVMAGLLPLRLMFDTDGLMRWQMAYLQAEPAHIQARLATWSQLMTEVIQRVQQYQVPLIMLRKETPKDAVCQVFEKVNTGGVALTVFELLTATYAATDFDLRNDWNSRLLKLKKHKVLANIESTEFLQAVTLLATYARRKKSLSAGTSADAAPGISCKRKDILRLTLEDYRAWADTATSGLFRAATLLYDQNIFSARDIPYRTQLIPLAAIFATLGGRADTDGVLTKLTRWYWCGVFGELYGSALETRFARDLAEVVAWVEGGAEPSTIIDANFAPARLLSLRTRNSAAYKGLAVLLLRDGGRDFRTGFSIDAQIYDDENIDIHHIFPKAWCKQQGIEPSRYDSVVNKTPLSAKTNRIIGGNAPSTYLARLQKSADISDERMGELLESHVIEPARLRSDDFKGFFEARELALLQRIEKAMGKKIAAHMTEMDAGPLEVVATEEDDTGDEFG